MWTDTHCHVLYGIDDGPATREESWDLLTGLADLGFTTVVATPHSRAHLWPNSPETIHGAVGDLQEAAGARGIRLLPGSETLFEPELFDRVREGRVVPLGAGDHLLVELAGVPPPRLLDALFRLSLSGYQVVLAHPERTEVLDLIQLRDLVDRGVLLQVTLTDLGGKFGPAVRKRAERILGEGLAGLLATDAHAPGDPPAYLEGGLAAARRATGERGLAYLLGAAAAAVAGLSGPATPREAEGVGH